MPSFNRKSGYKSYKDLWRKGIYLLSKGKKEQAEETLKKAADTATSPIDKHYAYLKLIKLYEILYEETGDNLVLQKLEDTCKRDIELFPYFYEAWIIERQNTVAPPNFPSFQTLAVLYESQGRIQEALDICQLALGCGQTSTLPEGFEGMIQRLQGKL